MFLLQEAISPCGEPETYLEMVQKSYLNWSIAPDAEVGGRGYKIPAQEVVVGFQGKEVWNQAGWATDGGWDLKHVDMGSSNKVFEQPELLWASRPIPCIWQRALGLECWHNLKPSTASCSREWRGGSRGEQGARASFPGTCSPWPFIYLRGVGHTEPKKLLKRRRITNPELFNPVHLKAHPLHSRMFFKWPLFSKVPFWT